jgi:hypothetical protein
MMPRGARLVGYLGSRKDRAGNGGPVRADTGDGTTTENILFAQAFLFNLARSISQHLCLTALLAGTSKETLTSFGIVAIKSSIGNGINASLTRPLLTLGSTKKVEASVKSSIFRSTGIHGWSPNWARWSIGDGTGWRCKRATCRTIFGCKGGTARVQRTRECTTESMPRFLHAFMVDLARSISQHLCLTALLAGTSKETLTSFGIVAIKSSIGNGINASLTRPLLTLGSTKKVEASVKSSIFRSTGIHGWRQDRAGWSSNRAGR